MLPCSLFNLSTSSKTTSMAKSLSSGKFPCSPFLSLLDLLPFFLLFFWVVLLFHSSGTPTLHFLDPLFLFLISITGLDFGTAPLLVFHFANQSLNLYDDFFFFFFELLLLSSFFFRPSSLDMSTFIMFFYLV